MAARTEITVVSGERYLVEGSAEEIERAVLDASRGAILQLAWMVDAQSGERLGFNPAHVAVLRSAQV